MVDRESLMDTVFVSVHKHATRPIYRSLESRRTWSIIHDIFLLTGTKKFHPNFRFAVWFLKRVEAPHGTEPRECGGYVPPTTYAQTNWLGENFLDLHATTCK